MIRFHDAATRLLGVAAVAFGFSSAPVLAESQPGGAPAALDTAPFDFSPFAEYEVMSCGAGYRFDPEVRDCVELGQTIALCPPDAIDVGEGCLCPGEIFVPYGATSCPGGPTPTNFPTPTPTLVPPTATPIPPTATPVPPTVTPFPTFTPQCPPTFVFDEELEMCVCPPGTELQGGGNELTRVVEGGICVPVPTEPESPGPSTTPAGIQNVPGGASGPNLPVFLIVMIAALGGLLYWARRGKRS